MIFGNEADGALQPYGVYWRLGANAATEITFNQDVTFAGEPVKAGTYRMYAVPGAENFTVTLNSEVDVFFGVAEADPELDLVTVDAPVEQPATEVETFTISFSATEKIEEVAPAMAVSETDSMSVEMSAADTLATDMSEPEMSEPAGVTINFSWDQTVFTVPVAIQ